MCAFLEQKLHSIPLLPLSIHWAIVIELQINKYGENSVFYFFSTRRSFSCWLMLLFLLTIFA